MIIYKVITKTLSHAISPSANVIYVRINGYEAFLHIAPSRLNWMITLWDIGGIFGSDKWDGSYKLVNVKDML